MKTPNEIKFAIQKRLPSSVFSSIYYIWTNIISPLFNIVLKIKLLRFRKEIFKTVMHDGQVFKILISPKNGTVDSEIYLHGVYEPYFLSIIKKELKEGDTFVDVGANIGQHSLFASQVVGGAGLVISFEPLPKIYEQFKASIGENKKNNKCNNVNVYNLGCGEKEEEVTIFMADNVGASSIVDSNRGGEKVNIKIVRADSIIEKLDRKVDFIKIDVEGYEYEALLGLNNTLETQNPKILIEYSPYYYRLSDAAKGRKIIDMILELGYTIYDLEDNRKIVDKNSFELFENKNMMQTNFLCIYKNK